MIFSPDRSPSSFLTSPLHSTAIPSSPRRLSISPSPLHPLITPSSPRHLFIPPSSPHLSIPSTSPVAATFPRHLRIPSSSVHPTATPSSPRHSCTPLVIPAEAGTMRTITDVEHHPTGGQGATRSTPPRNTRGSAGPQGRVPFTPPRRLATKRGSSVGLVRLPVVLGITGSQVGRAGSREHNTQRPGEGHEHLVEGAVGIFQASFRT